jgi:hypothetical protein
MPDIAVRFLSFAGCPPAPKALQNLEQAAGQLHGRLRLVIKQVDLMDSETRSL